jgi:hypothetical protein
VTGVRGDAANLDDLDRLFDTVKRPGFPNKPADASRGVLIFR